MHPTPFAHNAEKARALTADPARAALWLAGDAALLAASVTLSLAGPWYLWVLGQLAFGVLVFHAFALLHDFGHGVFFRGKALNIAFGHLASLFCIVPFLPWRSIHRSHHVWTGHADKDPTAGGANRRVPSAGVLAVIDACWLLWIPIFTLAFSFGNFWNPRKIARFTRSRAQLAAHLASLLLLPAAYAAAVYALGAPLFLRVWAGGYLVFLVMSDPILLSQHGGIPQAAAKTKPFPVQAQDAFTRSLIFPRVISRYVLLSFNDHTAHHAFPRVPLYHLPRLAVRGPHDVGAWTWLVGVKSARVTPWLLAPAAKPQTSAYESASM